jgi:hypothetical protein
MRENLGGEEWTRYSGLRRDESDPRKHTPYEEWDDWFECRVFHPIMDWSKQMCFDYCEKVLGQQTNPLYRLGFNRVGCAPCINSGRDDIRNWAKRFPEIIERVRGYERESGRTFFSPMVPGKEINWIDEVVAWANEVPRSKGQLALEVLLPAPVCESKFGLCE